MTRTALALSLACVAAVALSAAACSTVLDVDFGAAHLASTNADGDDGGAGTLPGACTPKSCADQGFTCGAQNDGCGGGITCGDCANGAPCVNGKCVCTPKTCPELGATCGVVDNGCGATLDCGQC